MIVCPVCEHPQAQGAECEVCGKQLVDGATADLALASVEGLETTAHPPIDTASERLGELEPTHHAPAALVEERTPIEATAAAPVDVDVAPVPDIEQTASGIPGDAPTALPAIVACRYCRTPAVAGERLCTRCGMRLPVLGPSPAEAAVAARICSCGLTVRASRCPGCGARTP
jgi:hypothetical protein